MMDCNRARSKMDEYIDGLLSDEESAAFEEHISFCEKCHEEYDMIKSMTTDLSSVQASLPEGFSRRMHAAVVSEQLASGNGKGKEKGAFFRFTKYHRFATVAVAVMVVAVIGKYGIYDVYKDVLKENTIASEQIKEKNGAEVDGYTAPSDVITEKETEPATDASQKAVNVAENKAPDISVEGRQGGIVKKSAEKNQPVQPADNDHSTPSAQNVSTDVQPEIADSASSDTPLNDTALAAAEEALADAFQGKEATSPSADEETQKIAENSAEAENTGETAENGAGAFSRMMPAEAVAESGENTENEAEENAEAKENEEDVSETDDSSSEKTASEEAGKDAISSGGGQAASEQGEGDSAANQPSAEDEGGESVKITEGAHSEVTDSEVPTIVAINKSGDGSMLVFKKYLYTFLNSSQIKEGENIITVTVGIEEFDDVIEKISKNEYVKSVTKGTIVNGVATIIIQ